MSEGWPLVPLAEVLVQDRDYIDAPEPREYPKLSVKLYGRGVVLDAPANGAELKMQRHQLARAGQVILSEIWGKKGAIGLVPSEGDSALCTSHFFLFDLVESRIERGYLQLLFQANYLEPQLGGEARGTTGYAAVRPKHLLSAAIPLPSIEEQRRIVARVEAIAVKVEEAQRLRRKARIEAEALSKAQAIRVLSLPSADRAPVERFAEVRGGIQKTPSRTAAGSPVRYLTVAHVQRDRILVGDPRYFDVTADELARWRLEPGDVLVIEGNGSVDQIGRTALFRGEIRDCVHQNHVIRIRTDPKVADPEFVNAFLNSPLGRDAIQAESRTTSGLRTLSVGRIKGLLLPLPALSEQRSCLAALDGLRAQTETLSDAQGETEKEIDALLPAVLDRAFRGEL